MTAAVAHCQVCRHDYHDERPCQVKGCTCSVGANPTVFVLDTASACTKRNPMATSQECGATKVKVHRNGHAWCIRCGATKPVPVKEVTDV